jgi:hypothetical protein
MSKTDRNDRSSDTHVPAVQITPAKRHYRNIALLQLTSCSIRLWSVNAPLVRSSDSPVANRSQKSRLINAFLSGPIFQLQCRHQGTNPNALYNAVMGHCTSRRLYTHWIAERIRRHGLRPRPVSSGRESSARLGTLRSSMHIARYLGNRFRRALPISRSSTNPPSFCSSGAANSMFVLTASFVPVSLPRHSTGLSNVQ